jgi:signal peptidase II
MPSARRLAFIAAVLWVVDVITKSLIVGWLDDGRTVHVIWTLQLALGYNSGFAFSQGEGLGPVIGAVAVVAIVALIRMAIKATNPFIAHGLAVIVSGAIGNVTDRVFRGDGWLHGRVVDFIDFQWFPSFNVADTCITIGAGLVIIGLVQDSRHAEALEAK